MDSNKEVEIGGSWLTVNRACNLRCKWCYAEGTKYNREDDMTLELAKKLVNFQSELGVENVILIGGEPTLWPHLFEIIELISQKGMKSALVTNGLLLANEKYLQKLKTSSIGGISLSIKSGNKDQHKEIAGSSEFDKVVKAIKSISKSDIPVDFSITINSLILDNLDEIVKVAAGNGAKSITLDFCTTTFLDGQPQKGYMPNPRNIVTEIVKKYAEMAATVGGNLFLNQTLPICIWPEEFLDDLLKKKKVGFGCHAVEKNGLIFDPKGRLLICNCLYDFPIGAYGKDFWDVKSFKEFWNNKNVLEAYDDLVSYPSQACIGCKHYDICGGGCPLHWFVNEPKEIIHQ